VRTTAAESVPQRYVVFGRRIRSVLRLPALRRDDGDAAPTAGPDIRVHRGRLPATPADVSADLSRVYTDPDGEFSVHATDDRGTFYWFYDGVGVLRVRDGTEVTLSTAPDGPGPASRRFVRGPGVRTALVQQGAVVLHASAVAVDGRAVAFAGPSGRGKSTTAAALVSAGHALLTDDVLPATSADAGTAVPPGCPSLSLDGDTAGVLGFDPPEGDGPVSVTDRFADGPRPLATVYLLSDGPAVDVEALSAHRAVFGLLRASYPLYSETDRAAQGRHLHACRALAGDVRVCRLTRPRSLSALDDVVRAVRDDLSDQ
jgi:hypothetical protein